MQCAKFKAGGNVHEFGPEWVFTVVVTDTSLVGKRYEQATRILEYLVDHDSTSKLVMLWALLDKVRGLYLERGTDLCREGSDES